ncbi:MAG: type II toxin-antitoxin system PemK/MazF family toxin [Chitinispirillales bacterium]|jgi:mRNA interferase MazF|nr:type II toxin-antitoxin system PemK/MazF family toxin [Chitinispirillales bacterium]
MYKRGEIVLVPIPFSDLSSLKKRPVLVISNISHNSASKDIIVIAITSNLQQNGIIIETKDLLGGKLPKPSLIRCEKIYTLDQRIVIKRFGTVSENVLDRVITEINRLITG